jgi:hypothetical protein
MKVTIVFLLSMCAYAQHLQLLPVQVVDPTTYAAVERQVMNAAEVSVRQSDDYISWGRQVAWIFGTIAVVLVALGILYRWKRKDGLHVCFFLGVLLTLPTGIIVFSMRDHLVVQARESAQAKYAQSMIAPILSSVLSQFETLDKNGDGIVSQDELAEAQRINNNPVLREGFNLLLRHDIGHQIGYWSDGFSSHLIYGASRAELEKAARSLN